MPTTEELRREGYEIWQTVAPSWERRRAHIEATVGPVGEWMIDELDPRPGDTLLELAAGVGDTGFEAVRRAGPGARLICSDFAPAMLDAARRRGAALGLDEVVDYRLLDPAERFDLDTGAVDGVLCRYGYMLMADAAAALAQTRRVLRPGGRVALAVWGPPPRNPMFSIVGRILVGRGRLAAPDPQGPGIFSMADPQRTTALLRGAGFEEVRTEELTVSFGFTGVDDLLGFLADTSGQLAVALADLTDGERDEVAGEVQEGLAAFATGDGYRLPSSTLVAVAR